MLVDEHNSDILSLLSEPVESGLDRSVVSLAIDDQEVLLGICAGSDVLLNHQLSRPCGKQLNINLRQCPPGAIPSQSPTLRQQLAQT